MIISDVEKSLSKEGYEIRVSFENNSDRVFWCKAKNDIVIRQKRLQKLRYRLSCLVKEFMNIRKWFPEQESVSAENMVRYLFQYDKINIEIAVRDFLSAAKSGNWDIFYSQYFSQLEWIGSASKEEVERQLDRLYFTKHYKKALQELTKKRNLEVVLFLRLLMETGIRARDVYQMDSSCIEGKRVRVRPSKQANADFYHCPNGSLPQISKSTLHIAEVLNRTQGKWFTKPFDYYVYMLHKIWNQPYFSLHVLRRYWVERERRIFLEAGKSSKNGRKGGASIHSAYRHYR